MAITDVVTMLGNLSQSMLEVQRLVTGFAYMLGIVFFFVALQKLRVIGNSRARSSSQEKMFVPITYLVVGTALVFLPTAMGSASVTVFGTQSILQYASFNEIDVYQSVSIIIKTVGVIWFIRGAVLLAHASQPGEKHGTKGLLFLIAGIFCVNFDGTVSTLDSMMQWIIEYTLSVKEAQGY